MWYGIRFRTVQPLVSLYTNWATRPTLQHVGAINKELYNELSVKCAFIKYVQLELKLVGVCGRIFWRGVDMDEVQKLILFPATKLQVSALETGLKASWELDQLPLGEPEIVLSVRKFGLYQETQRN